MTLSNEALDAYISHNISKLNICGAPELSHLETQWLNLFFFNSILRFKIASPERQYMINFLRRVESAFKEYSNARTSLAEFVNRPDNSVLSPYFRSLSYFEHLLAHSYQAIELLKQLLKIQKLFIKDDGSFMDKLNKTYNISKHMNTTIAQGNLPSAGATIPIWITNEGIECDILSAVKNIGLFIVPVGELESWVDVGTRRKKHWIVLALEKIWIGESPDNLKKFTKNLLEYLGEGPK